MSVRPSPLLLQGKTSPPLGGAAQVPRAKLMSSLIEGAGGARLILVRAPAGFGKTTAMQQYRSILEQRKVRTSWLTLDRADNDAGRFHRCLAMAVRPLLARRGKEAGSTQGVHLITQLARSKHPLVLFLDEYEVLHDEGVQSLVSELIDNLPPTAQVIIGTRTTPRLNLGKLRARGLLYEVGPDDLRFSFQETNDFVRQRRGIDLVSDDLQRLHRKTEGWAAGLWLASAALARISSRSEFVQRFSGSDRALAEYLAEDVLNLQPPEARRFLLHTSILRTLSPDLCAALVPDVDSHSLLRTLDAENVLIERIDSESESYRYHSLFAGFMQAQLAREAPDELPRLHEIASRWFENQGRAVPAIDHALEARNFDRAISLISRHGPLMLREGRMRLLMRWCNAIPADAFKQNGPLQLLKAWSLACTKGASHAMAFLRDSGLRESDDPAVMANLLAIQPVLLSLMDRIDEAYEFGKTHLPDLPTHDAFADAVLLSVLADTCSSRGDTREAHRLLDMLRTSQGGAVGALNDMYAQSSEGTIALLEGRLREATARFRIAVTATASEEAGFTNGNAWAGLLYASTVYEANDIGQAKVLLRVYLPLAQEVGMPDHLILGYRMLARLAYDAAEPDEAFERVAQLEAIGHERDLPRVVASARLERARLQLAQGHVDAARDELERATQSACWASVAHLRLPASDLDYPELASLRLEVLAGDPERSKAGLMEAIQSAESGRRKLRGLKLRLLLALAEHRTGRSSDAIRMSMALLLQCHKEGFFRLVFDEGAAMGHLVNDVHRHLKGTDGARIESPSFGPWLAGLTTAFGFSPPSEADQEASQDGERGRVSLTQQELKILTLLAEGASNEDISRKLAVSDSTVRTHLRRMNEKLRVRSRLQAVAIARAHGLLS